MGEGAGFWFQPDFMYLGPGSYNDISPVDEHDDEQVGLGFGRNKGSDSDANQAGRAHISPETSAGTTPHTSNSQTVAATPVLDGVADVAATFGIKTVPMLGIINEPPSDRADLEAIVGASRITDEGESGCRAEGIVATADPQLFTRSGARVMWKLKFRDFLEADRG